MANYLFYTNIKCEACEAKIKTKFEEVEGVEGFSVDLSNEKRPLKVEVREGTSEKQVQNWIAEAGFEAKVARKSALNALFGKK